MAKIANLSLILAILGVFMNINIYCLVSYAESFDYHLEQPETMNDE